MDRICTPSKNDRCIVFVNEVAAVVAPIETVKNDPVECMAGKAAEYKGIIGSSPWPIHSWQSFPIKHTWYIFFPRYPTHPLIQLGEVAQEFANSAFAKDFMKNCACNACQKGNPNVKRSPIKVPGGVPDPDEYWWLILGDER
jgi:hypothetical protein